MAAPYAADEFLAVVPRVDRVQADAMKTRLQEGLKALRVPIRGSTQIGLPVKVGLAMFPEDGTDLSTLAGVSNWQARDVSVRTVQTS